MLASVSLATPPFSLPNCHGTSGVHGTSKQMWTGISRLTPDFRRSGGGAGGLLDASAPECVVRVPSWPGVCLGKGQMGSALMGVTANVISFDRGTFWVLMLTCFYLPKSARAYLFPQSVNIPYFCSGPISVDPIRPQPTAARGSHPHVPRDPRARRPARSPGQRASADVTSTMTLIIWLTNFKMSLL